MTKLNSHKMYAAITSVLMAISPMVSAGQSLNQKDAGNVLTMSAINSGKSKSDLHFGRIYFISADRLNVRSSNSTTAYNIVGQLTMNDQVEIYDLLNEATPLVQIKIITSATVKANVAAELFVSKDFLSDKQIETAESKYFVIQNIATEKTRVYERCTTSPSCPHKLVMETEMVVGRPEVGTKEDLHAFKTWLGHAKISEWIKFYQDGKGHYPHWYRAGQDFKTIPSPISKGASNLTSSRKWITKSETGEQTVYGAFGWYAAKVTPADEIEGMNYQWMHGTIGWGRDGATSIELTRGFLMNLFSNPGSSGCTRLENRAIAYLRYLLPLGTNIYRVYARESTREKEMPIGNSNKQILPLPRYTDAYYNRTIWPYILLTNGAQQSGGLTADAYTIYKQHIPIIQSVNLIEQGSYIVDQYPNATPLNYNNSAHSGKSGDRYSIDDAKDKYTDRSNFKGYFLVDEGRFVGYQHPDQEKTKGVIHVSGLPDFRKSVPEFLKTSGVFNLPSVQSVESEQKSEEAIN